MRDSSSSMPRLRSWGRYVVVGDGERGRGAPDRAAMVAQTFKGLRAGHLMDEMTVDIDDRCAVVVMGDDMIVQILSNSVRGLVMVSDQLRRSCWRPTVSPAAPGADVRRRFRSSSNGPHASPRYGPPCRYVHEGNRAWRAHIATAHDLGGPRYAANRAKDLLDAFTVGCLAHRERRVQAAVLARDTYAS